MILLDFDFDFAPRRRLYSSRLRRVAVAQIAHTQDLLFVDCFSVFWPHLQRATCYVQRSIKCSTTKAFQIQIQIQIAASADPNLQRGTPSATDSTSFLLCHHYPRNVQRATRHSSAKLKSARSKGFTRQF